MASNEGWCVAVENGSVLAFQSSLKTLCMCVCIQVLFYASIGKLAQAIYLTIIEKKALPGYFLVLTLSEITPCSMRDNIF